jgi:hypothetical protein
MERYSPLQELIESTPGYYVGDDTIVYSEELGRPGLKRISRQITREFYTPRQLARIIRKIFAIRLFKPHSIPLLIASIPVVLGLTIKRKLDKKMKRSMLVKRLFPKWA